MGGVVLPASGSVSGVAEAGLPAEIAFLAGHGVPDGALQDAAKRAARIRVSPARQVLASGLVTEAYFYRALARDKGLPFAEEVPALQPGGELAAIQREGMARARAREGSRLRFVVAPPPGLVLQHFLAADLRGREDLVMVTPSALAAELRRANADALARHAAWLDEAGTARFSARTGSNRLQKAIAHLLVGGLAFLATLAPVPTMIAVALALGPLFFGAVLLRLATLFEPAPTDLWRDHRWQIDDSRLPVYTVAVPLFGEEAVLDQSIAALSALDYPALGSKLTQKNLRQQNPLV